jgi:hypothetical protein
MRHTVINSKEVGIVMRNSSLLLSASDIYATTGIVANSSRLDIAGTDFYINHAIVQNGKVNENVYVIFSISRKIHENMYKILHGSYVLTGNQKL